MATEPTNTPTALQLLTLQLGPKLWQSGEEGVAGGITGGGRGGPLGPGWRQRDPTDANDANVLSHTKQNNTAI